MCNHKLGFCEERKKKLVVLVEKKREKILSGDFLYFFCKRHRVLITLYITFGYAHSHALLVY